MSELVVINNQDYKLERVSEKVFNSPLVSKVNQEDLLDFVLQSITRLFNDCGQVVIEKDLAIQSVELIQSLNSQFSWVTVNEIPKIFALGRKNTFGEWYGLNLNTYEIWLSKYYQEKRANEIKRKRKLENKEVKPTPEENEKSFNNLLTELILEYQSTKKISSVYLYNELFKRKKLPKHDKKYIETVRKRAFKKVYKLKGSKDDNLLTIKRIALIKQSYKKGLSESEVIKILKRRELNDLKKEDYKIKKELMKIQEGSKNLNYYCKEIILIDYLNKIINNV